MSGLLLIFQLQILVFQAPNKNRKVSESKNVSLVLLPGGFQVVRMVKLLRTFGMCGLYQRGGEIGKEWQLIELSSPKGNRTPVSGVRGQRPSR